jgi:hypothetical protein
MRGGVEAGPTLQWVAAADSDSRRVGRRHIAGELIVSRGGEDAAGATTALIALTAEPQNGRQ